jgi:hypothetical protein
MVLVISGFSEVNDLCVGGIPVAWLADVIKGDSLCDCVDMV